MAEIQEQINEITITRSTKVKGEFAERGTVLKVGSNADIEKNDARFLLRSGKALPGRQTRIAEAHAEEKKTAELARAAQATAGAVAGAAAGDIAELEKQLDESDAQLEAAEDRAASAEARALDAEKRAAEAEKALAAANKKAGK
ncbi:hypothetical protein [Microbulbifer sp. ALW1]|uniref:hypothetical protein n=1 Tax=Microbulbifer sp. (strain ALW1) TaxID=1516059 RepID=UPI001359D409|nr:hypothetical protein [Microbulbifer sp. ALW1]